MAVKRIQVFSDSQLVVNQVNRTFESKNEVLKKYLQLARSLISQFEDFSLTHIPREENQVADRLAKEGLPDLRRTQVLERPSFECTEVSFKEQPPCWMDRILDYLKNGIQPDNKQDAQKLKLTCAKYALIDGELYRRSYVKPLTKCLRPEETLKVMECIKESVEHMPGAEALLCESYARDSSGPTSTRTLRHSWKSAFSVNTMLICRGSLQVISSLSIYLGLSPFGGWIS
ncbi:hypothetical protein AXF42_Ash016821 [Apostasia shenzhenica]|uniref:RNase H type-1 domain-containing protein n=1 Tax=Apostasia shenzhenica TaxID=1088818 RepID=A0A2I0BAH2_9ASPA|nr:hypothetical protein AXF42_Ash016821 [Apostasia shenzhenica]